MSHIAIIRQRIKAIQTIQKTTSAMRLMAISLQGRLRKKGELCGAYRSTIQNMLNHYRTLHSETIAVPVAPTTPTQSPTLVILIASQKGLCGTFNEHLFDFFQGDYAATPESTIITVGTHATRFVERLHITPTRNFNTFSLSNFTAVAQHLTNYLLAATAPQVAVYSQHSRTFFIQQPQKTMLSWDASSTAAADDALYTYLIRLDLYARLVYLCYESLLAEQSARFLSMDSATRNAEDLLGRMKLEYNKTRQMLVTRELIELSGGFTTRD